MTGPGAGGRACELFQGLLPGRGSGVFGAEGLADLAAGLAPGAGQAAYGVVGETSGLSGVLKSGGFRQDWQNLEFKILISDLFFLDDKWQQEMLLV